MTDKNDGSAANAPEVALMRLIEIMARLRDPVAGCPWDIKQTFETIAPYTIEEAHEVADAIERGDWGDLRDELGDLLLQVVYHSRIAEERGLFAFADVAVAINDKLVRRHPHVFGGVSLAGLTDAQRTAQWEAIKKAEREAKGAVSAAGETSLFQDIPASMPALLRSAKIQQKAAQMSFDWPSVEPILEKVDEELQELRAEIAAHPGDPDAQRRQFEEFGDLMFVLVNLGRRLGIDAEAALRAANAKFVRRFESMQTAAAKQGLSLEGMTLDALDVLWNEVKAQERKATPAPNSELGTVPNAG